jgi:hypothetical protein
MDALLARETMAVEVREALAGSNKDRGWSACGRGDQA